jgi:hypothetical protein
MPQGIICISPITAFKDTFDLTIDPTLIDLEKLKGALLLPNRYIIERVNKPARYRDSAEIIVSSPDIPESQGEMPNVSPCYLSTTDSESPKTYTVSLQDILINGVSAIREEDKQKKRIIEVKEVKEALMNCDICDRDLPESTLMPIGEVFWMDRKYVEIFVCEECAQKVSDALAKRKETNQ